MHSVPATIQRGFKKGYGVGNSLVFNDDDLARLIRTPSTDGNLAKFTVSCWVKRGDTARIQRVFSAWSGTSSYFWVDLDDEDKITVSSYVGGASRGASTTVGVFRDPSAWFHLVIAIDVANASATERAIVYVDGVRQGVTIGTAWTQSYNTIWNSKVAHKISTYNDTVNPLDLYLSQVVNIDGQALTPDSFGEWHPLSPNVWRPIYLSGLDYSGVNSFLMDFADPANIGKDVSGNGIDWSPVNLVASDVVTDSPSNNVCTLNSVERNALTFSEGNMKEVGTALDYMHGFGTFGLTSGKWYCEFISEVEGNDIYTSAVGLATDNVGYLGDLTVAGQEWYLFRGSDSSVAKIYTPAGGRAYGERWAAGNTIGMAFDLDNGNLEFFIDGVSQGLLPSEIDITLAPFKVDVMARRSGDTLRLVCNEDEFSFTPPAGFNAMMTKYLPRPAIPDAKEYFAPVIYTGSGAQRVIDTQNKVDHVVIKNRNAASSWSITDSVRGVNKQLKWDASNAEDTRTGHVQDFGAESGFRVGNNADVNGSGNGIVAYPFTKSPIAGMDIVTYVGDGIAGHKIPHNLGVKPAMMLTKVRSTTSNWVVYLSVLGANYLLHLDATTVATDDVRAWNATEPTATDFTLGAGFAHNNNGNSCVAYLFADVEGFCKVFSYTGNGLIDGPLVNLGFKPALIISKSSQDALSWNLQDLARSPYNVATLYLIPDGSGAEGQNIDTDFLSNGFKVRNAGTATNKAGRTYVGIAFAEYPFAMLNNWAS